MTDPLFRLIDKHTDPKLRPFGGRLVLTLELTGMFQDEEVVFERMDELLNDHTLSELEELGYATIESEVWIDDGTDY